MRENSWSKPKVGLCARKVQLKYMTDKLKNVIAYEEMKRIFIVLDNGLVNLSLIIVINPDNSGVAEIFVSKSYVFAVLFTTERIS